GRRPPARPRGGGGRRPRPDTRGPPAPGGPPPPGSGPWPPPRPPRPPAAPPAKPPKASPADPASRVMPAKKGGFDQLRNVQVLAGKHQGIYALPTHGNPTRTRALHPPLPKAPAHLGAARVSPPVRKALFDARRAR